MSSLTGSASHLPVLLDRVLELLEPVAGGAGAVVVDATVGLGGHTAALLERHPELRMIGIDRDPSALAHSERRLAAHRDRVRLVHGVYDTLPQILDAAGVDRVDGVLFDLGVSSTQLDDDERGFAYSRDTDLDMRMDPTRGLTAADIVNDYGRYTCGCAILETAERLAGEERNPMPALQRLTVGALRAVADASRPRELVLDAYLLRAMGIAGWAPAITECARCAAPCNLS